MSAELSRREFLKAGAGLAALSLVPPAAARPLPSQECGRLLKEGVGHQSLFTREGE